MNLRKSKVEYKNYKDWLHKEIQAFQGLVAQTPATALDEPGDRLNFLTKIFSFLKPLPSFSGDSFHVLLRR